MKATPLDWGDGNSPGAGSGSASRCRGLVARPEYESIHVGKIGMWNAADDAILAFASGKHAAVVTLDADFHAILAVAPHYIRRRRMLPFDRQSIMIVAHMRSFGVAMRPALLSPLLVFMLMQPAPVHGSDTPGCLSLGKPETLSGRLVRVDQRGYMEWIVLALPRPICALTDPTDRSMGAVRGVTAVEAVSVNSETVGSQLRRFLGKRIMLTGVLNTGLRLLN